LTDLSLGIIPSIPQYSMQCNKAIEALKQRSERAKTMGVTVHEAAEVTMATKMLDAG
jgi:hypothetical protein